MPVLYEFTGAALVSKGRLDVPEKKAVRGARTPMLCGCGVRDRPCAGMALSAMDKFKTLDRKGTVDSALTETSLESTHQNAISCLSVIKGGKDGAEQLCTTGADGKVVLWTLVGTASGVHDAAAAAAAAATR